MASFWSAENALLAATLATTRPNALNPVDKLKTPYVGRRYRIEGLAAGDTETTITIALPAPQSLDVVFLQRPRFRASVEAAQGPTLAATDLVRHQFATDANFTAPLAHDSGWIQSGVLPGVGVHAYVTATPVTAQFIRLRINALSRATAPRNFVDLGILWYGKRKALKIGFAAPFGLRPIENARKTRAADAPTLYVGRRRMHRRIDATFRSVKAFERPDMIDFMNETADGGRFLFCADDADLPRQTMIGVNETPTLDQTSRAFSRFPFALDEAI